MRVLILGGGGTLGHKLFEALGQSLDVYATFRSRQGCWRRYPFYRDDSKLLTGIDVRQFGSVVRAFARSRPEVVINCVGIVKQRPEAEDPITSLEVNSLFPHRLAELCQAADARLIHVSTDCVFSGRRGAYSEFDPSDAEDLYGRSKFLGEVTRGCLTLRTSMVGWNLCDDHGLLEWFIRQQGGRIKGFTRAIFSGLSTAALSDVIASVIVDHPHLEGLFHVSSEPISKHQLLDRLRQAMGMGVEIKPVDHPAVDRSLDSTLFRQATGCPIPGWDKMLAELAKDRARYDQWT